MTLARTAGSTLGSAARISARVRVSLNLARLHRVPRERIVGGPYTRDRQDTPKPVGPALPQSQGSLRGYTRLLLRSGAQPAAGAERCDHSLDLELSASATS
jgi:hypothetical protein